MRKVVIALILVLPMIFVLILFSSVNLASINVRVSVNGINIYADGDPVPDGEALYVEMTDMHDHIVTAQVTPSNAYEKGYTLESDNDDVLTINSEGVITAHSVGTATVKATSKDKGFTATIPVVVTSEKAYDVAFTLYDGDGNAVSMDYIKSTSTYTVSDVLSPGTYTYKVDIYGGDSKDYTLTSENDPYGIRALIKEGDQSIMLPFSGSTTLKLEVNDAIANGMLNQTIRRTVKLNVAKASSENGIVINGVPDGNTVLLAKGAKKTFVYVECESEPEVEGEGIASVRCLVHDIDSRAANDNCHKLEITLNEGIVADELQATLTAGGKSLPIKLSFADFDFDLRSSIMNVCDGEYSTLILKDTETAIYAVPAVEMADVEYVWTVNEEGLTIQKTNKSGSKCSFNATRNGEYLVTVQAKRGDVDLGGPKRMNVTVTTKVNSVWITNPVSVDLAERYTVGGKKFAANQNIVGNEYVINIMVSKKGSGPRPNDFEGIEVTSSDEDIASVKIHDDKAYLDLKSNGAISVTVKWEYIEEFGGSTTQSIDLNIVLDAVEVANYSQLRNATEEGYKVVLTKNIMLGTDDNGRPMSISSRQEIINAHKYASTYNVAWYAEKDNLANAQIAYAMEFKNDVYGNGFEINADYFANALDASGKPLLFKGPLSFVALGENYSAARVAAQDNCAFLIRTDGIMLYGVNLLGCSDDALYDKKGEYALKQLNNVGTTLEVNADCDIINCRIRNGRNVVRVYGGNRNADHSNMSYYVNSISSTYIDDDDRIIVNIKGCIVTQGREFLVKAGTNRALKASPGNVQPPLRNAQGVAYKETMKNIDIKDESGSVHSRSVGTNQYADIQNDEFFYNCYVMTDLTIEDSVLETSGLFTIGVESNFAGEVLCEGSQNTFAEMLKKEGWANSGATSFAAMVRLVGDVRMYDWKDVANVDSSSLIESADPDKFGSNPLEGILKFDLSSMLLEVDGQEEYAKLLYNTSDGKKLIHGGIAFYGGGRNYSMLDISKLNEDLDDLTHLNINVEQFSTSNNPTTSKQTRLLPLAAGTHDFNFWMYTADGQNNYAKQERDEANGQKYVGVTKIPLFSQ